MLDPLTTPLLCLFAAIYFEARGEPPAGQAAVAHVIMNRVASARYPDDICSVVKQPAQFSFFWDGKSDQPGEPRAYMQAVLIALAVVDGEIPDNTGGAMWYHANYVAPSWRLAFAYTGRIGRHLFYRET